MPWLDPPPRRVRGRWNRTIQAEICACGKKKSAGDPPAPAEKKKSVHKSQTPDCTSQDSNPGCTWAGGWGGWWSRSFVLSGVGGRWVFVFKGDTCAPIRRFVTDRAAQGGPERGPKNRGSTQASLSLSMRPECHRPAHVDRVASARVGVAGGGS